jgi:glutaminyl-tRNA synthetase
VSGWDDPRMPTLAGIRRRGVTPEAMRHFATRVGVAKNNSTVDLALFEHTLREDLSEVSPRVMGVLKPLKVVIENYPEGQTEELDAPYWPHDIPKEGTRKLPFSRELLIEADDFMEQPAKKWFRLAPGREVRLRHACIIKCERVVKDESGAITELRCSYDADTRGENAPGARKVKGTLHWVSAAHALDAEVRLYDRLFSAEFPGADERDFKEDLNQDSLQTVRAKLEPSLASAEAGERYQLERLGFFYVDPIDSKDGAPVLNRTVGLRDTWAKIAARAEPSKPEAAKPQAAKSAAAPKAAATAALPPEAQALIDAHSLAPGEARVLAASPALSRIFADSVKAGAEPRAAASWLVSELPAALDGRDAGSVKFDGKALAELVALLDAGTISRPAAKDVLAELVKSGGSPKAIVEQKGLQQLGGDALAPVIDKVLADNASLVERYKAGNPNLLGALVGQVMRASGGKADPKLAGEMLREKLA